MSDTAKTRRTLLGAFVATAGAGVLAACGASQTSTSTGSSSAASGSTGSSSAAQTGAPKALAPATISFETFRGVAPLNWGDEMAKTFQDKNPGVKVEVRPIALDNGNQQSAYPKMLAAAQAGTLGDVHAWDPSHWQLYQAIKRGIIHIH